MTTGEMQIGFLMACVVLGMLGAGLGAWAFSHVARAQLEAQRQAFELAREQAQRDLQHALLCVPQWVQQRVRVELEFLGLQYAERHKAQFREQQRWQSEQDEQRRAEWRTLLSGSGAPRPPKVPPVAASRPERPVSVPAPSAASARPPELMGVPRPQPVPVYTPVRPEPELSDEEIDALPPDLPVPVRPQGRKISAPKKPILRNI